MPKGLNTFSKQEIDTAITNLDEWEETRELENIPFSQAMFFKEVRRQVPLGEVLAVSLYGTIVNTHTIADFYGVLSHFSNGIVRLYFADFGATGNVVAIDEEEEGLCKHSF
jgi:hypothetical protein